MDRHRAIRIAVGRLRGHARTAQMDYLLQHPEKIGKAQCRARKGLVPVRNIAVSCNLTPEQYLQLRDNARENKVSMSQLIAACLQHGKVI